MFKLIFLTFISALIAILAVIFLPQSVAGGIGALLTLFILLEWLVKYFGNITVGEVYKKIEDIGFDKVSIFIILGFLVSVLFFFIDTTDTYLHRYIKMLIVGIFLFLTTLMTSIAYHRREWLKRYRKEKK